MNILQALILSIIEGFSEFLPISSTGHLILASKLLNISPTEFSKTFEIVIQIGAIMAVVVLYYKKFLTSLDIYKKLFIAFLPTAVVGFSLYPLIKGYFFENPNITVISLFLGGVFLLIFEKFHKISSDHTQSTKRYFIIGLFQSLSIIPGVSRAGATIIGGMFSGLDRKSATEFSFLLAVPTMFAATTLDLYKTRHILASANLYMLGVGTIFSFFFALMSVKFLIKYVESHDFRIFGIYRIILAIWFWLFVK